MTLRRTALSLLLASACAPAFAATLDLTSLNDATLSSTPRVVVKFRDGTAERTQANARRLGRAALTASDSDTALWDVLTGSDLRAWET